MSHEAGKHHKSGHHGHKHHTATMEERTAELVARRATVEPGVADWQCYRYRESVVVVPLRNLVLGLRS